MCGWCASQEQKEKPSSWLILPLDWPLGLRLGCQGLPELEPKAPWGGGQAAPPPPLPLPR